MGGDLNKFLSEALAEGGRLGAEAAIRRTDQQRQLGIAIAQKLAASGEFNNLPPQVQGGYKKLLGETSFAGLSQLSDINSQLATIRRGAQAQLQAPVIEEATINVPRDQAPSSAIDQYIQAQPPGMQGPPVVPEQIPQTVMQERRATDSEIFDRVKRDAAAAQLIGGTDFANVILNEMQLKHKENVQLAKTQAQHDMNARLTELLGRSDQNDPEQGAGISGMSLRGASINPETGNMNLNLGVIPIDEIRQNSVDTTLKLMQEALKNGSATPNEIMIGQQAKGSWHGTPAQAEQIMENMASQIVSTQTKAGASVEQALLMARAQTGRIPKGYEQLLPENVQQAYNIQRAKDDAGLATKLTDPYLKAASVDRSLAIAAATAQKLVENQLTPLTPKEKETAALELDTIRRLQRLHANFRKSFLNFGRGLIPTRVLDIFGSTKEGEVTFRAETAQLQAQYIKAITGAQMSEPEARRLLAGVFSIKSDSAGMFEAKTILMLHNMDQLIRIRKAIQINGGKRWGADTVMKTVEINGIPVQVVDEAASGAVVDKSLHVDFNSQYETQAGIAVFSNGTVQTLGNPDDTATVTPTEIQNEFSAARAKVFGGQ